MGERRRKSAPKYWTVKNGSLYARLQYKNDSGKWANKYKPIADKRTARSVVEEMRAELSAHGEDTLRADRVTFGQVADEYLTTVAVPPVYRKGKLVEGMRSHKTVKILVRVAREQFGGKLLRSIKPADIERFKAIRLRTATVHGKDRSIATVHRELAYLRAVLNFAVKQGYITRNPFQRAKKVISPALEDERDRVLSREEEERLLAACEGPRDHLRAILICALDTAMRRGEIFKMKWVDISFGTSEITIPQTNTKTETARTVGMTIRLKKELRRLWDASSQDESELVFGIESSAKTAFKTACKLAGIEDFQFHDCRHTATTRMIASGSPHAEVMKITGHTRLKTFLRYLNITTETASKVASNLDQLLNLSVNNPSHDLLN